MYVLDAEIARQDLLQGEDCINRVFTALSVISVACVRVCVAQKKCVAFILLRQNFPPFPKDFSLKLSY